MYPAAKLEMRERLAATFGGLELSQLLTCQSVLVLRIPESFGHALLAFHPHYLMKPVMDQTYRFCSPWICARPEMGRDINIQQLQKSYEFAEN